MIYATSTSLPLAYMVSIEKVFEGMASLGWYVRLPTLDDLESIALQHEPVYGSAVMDMEDSPPSTAEKHLHVPETAVAASPITQVSVPAQSSEKSNPMVVYGVTRKSNSLTQLTNAQEDNDLRIEPVETLPQIHEKSRATPCAPWDESIVNPRRSATIIREPKMEDAAQSEKGHGDREETPFPPSFPPPPPKPVNTPRHTLPSAPPPSIPPTPVYTLTPAPPPPGAFTTQVMPEPKPKKSWKLSPDRRKSLRDKWYHGSYLAWKSIRYIAIGILVVLATIACCIGPYLLLRRRRIKSQQISLPAPSGLSPEMFSSPYTSQKGRHPAPRDAASKSSFPPAPPTSNKCFSYHFPETYDIRSPELPPLPQTSSAYSPPGSTLPTSSAYSLPDSTLPYPREREGRPLTPVYELP
jgi:hypothetical protein